MVPALTIFSPKQLTDELREFCQLISVGEPSEDLIASILDRDPTLARTATMGDSNWLSPLVYHQLEGRVNGQLEGMEHLRHLYEHEESLYLARCEVLTEVADGMAREGIELAALKGTGLAHNVYPDPVTRPADDIDVLVKRDRFPDAIGVLNALGYQPDGDDPFDRPEEYHLRYGGQYEVCADRLGCKVILELHWRPISGETIFGDREPTATEFIDRSLPLHIANSTMRILSPEDNLLQNALHTSKHTYVRKPGLRMFADVDRLVASAEDFDWDRFVDATLGHRVAVPVYITLQIAADLFATPIPSAVLDELGAPFASSPLRRRFMTYELHKRGVFDARVESFSGPERLLFHLLLTDTNRDLAGLAARRLFPPRETMMVRYQIKNERTLPLHYLRHFGRVVFRQKA